MRKGTLFLSAVLTTFMLAILAGAVSAYQKNVKSLNTTGEPQAAAAQESGVPEMAAVGTISPEEAAALAAQVLGRNDLYSVETTDFNGSTVYLVTFSSGDLVYISMDGQILSITSIPPVVVSQPRSGNDGNGSGGSPQSGGQSFEDDDDGEDGEDAEHQEDHDEDEQEQEDGESHD